MTDKQDLIREIHEYVTTHGGENTATHLLVQAASAIQTQAAELDAVGAGGVQALSAAPAIGDELRDTLVAVSAAIAERDDRAAQKMICEILAASTTPPAEQQAQPGAVYAELYEPDATTVGLGAVWNRHSMRDFADRTYALRMQAAPKAAPTRTALPEGWTDCTIEFGNDGPEVVAYGPKRMMTRLAKWLGKYFAQVIAEAAPKAAPGEQNTVPAEWLEQAYREGWAACRDAETIGEEAEYWAFGNSTANSRMIDAQQAAPKAAQGVGNSGFDHKTAADFLSGKTISDEAVRKFVQASRWAHDEKASLSAMLISVRGELASREAEIALLKKALMEAEAAPQQEAQEPTEIPEEIERMAADRYKVVPSHESMFHRWAVVAGTGTQQLYLGREVECQNMARKFAGAFLDGAFVAMQRTSPQPAPAPLSDTEKAVRQERERLCAAIKAEDDYCIDNGDYMLDSDDCIKIVKGEWVRPDFSAKAALAAQGGK